jgi:hypothetical protein
MQSFEGSQGRTPPNEAFGARAGQSRQRATQHGAKTPARKSAASRNALRHGLAVAVTADPSLTDEVERLAQMIAGEGANPSRLERARRVAEAQIDLLRVRRARSLLNEARGGAKLPSGSGLFCAEDRTRAVLRALDAVNETGEPLEGIAELVAQLERFDRYEHSARESPFSRRSSAACRTLGETMEMYAGKPREAVADKARGGMVASLFICLLHGPFQPLCEIARSVNDTQNLDAAFN